MKQAPAKDDVSLLATLGLGNVEKKVQKIQCLGSAIILKKFSLITLVIVLTPLMLNAQILKFTFVLNGSNVQPPNLSLATTTGIVQIDIALKTMNILININETSLSSNKTAVHIHSATAIPYTGNSAAATPNFISPPYSYPNVSSLLLGWSIFLDMTNVNNYSAGFVTANGGTTNSAFVALYTAMINGKSYFDIHTANYAAGEIRGFLTPLYTFIGNGDWSNSTNWEGGSKPPANITGRDEIIIDPIAGGECVLQLSTAQSIGGAGKLTVKAGKKLRVLKDLIIQ
jgi:hypothetical protein